jgi:hypothetical protein
LFSNEREIIMGDGVFTKEELAEMGIDVEAEEEVVAQDPNEERTNWVVYYTGDQPDTAWSYHHNPPPELDENGNPQLDADGDEVRIPYGRLEGYWDEDKDAKVSRHYVPNPSNNLKLMDFDEFMEHVVPNKDCAKVFETESDFLLELL